MDAYRLYMRIQGTVRVSRPMIKKNKMHAYGKKNAHIREKKRADTDTICAVLMCLYARTVQREGGGRREKERERERARERASERATERVSEREREKERERDR
jgi:hypothetical protein